MSLQAPYARAGRHASSPPTNSQRTPFLEFKRSYTSTADFPDTFARYTQRFGAVYHWPEGGFYVVTRAKLAQQVLTRSEFSADRSSFFIARMPQVNLDLIKDFFAVVSKMMVMSDGRSHYERRRSASSGLGRPSVLTNLTPRIEAIVDELLGRLKAHGSLECVEELARPLPSLVLAELFDVPPSYRAEFCQHARTMTAFFGGAVTYSDAAAVTANKAALELYRYFGELVVQRRLEPRSDFFSAMLAMQSSSGLSDDEIISQAIMMLVAGQVTTSDQIANNLFLFLTNPQIRQTVSNDPLLLASALEEFGRYDPAVTFLFRVCRADYWLDGMLIKAGATVFVANHAINRDQEVYADPFSISLTRKALPHFGYGHGAHYCVGVGLARMQMNILFTTLMKNYPTLRLSPLAPPLRDHYSLAFSGFQELGVDLLGP